MNLIPVSGSLSLKKFVSTENNYSYQSINMDSNTLYVGGSGPDNYTKIQDALDDANPGDTVFVYNGKYLENIKINKNRMPINQAV